MRTAIRGLVALVLAGSFVVSAAPVAALPAPPDGPSRPASTVPYAPPVDAPVSDPFRPPTTPYGPGNRGIEFATTPGTEVGAAADGTVTFAGVVAGQRWVTLRHADGVRTTYGPLQDVTVVAGERVTRGQPIGTAAAALLLTARVGEAYIDPASLFDGGPVRVRLIPEPLDRPGLKKHGGSSIPGVDALVSALDWEWRHAALIPAAALAHTTEDLATNGFYALDEWSENRTRCTPRGAKPPPPTERRFVILVGGLGSSSASAAIADVNTDALGYERGDVVRFSYTGGRVGTSTPVSPELQGLPVNGYEPSDTVGDLEAAGHRLADVLVAMAESVPQDAPIDVLAHSQGGLVTRVALHDIEKAHPDVLAHVRLVVTLATPHHGADLAALVRAADTNSADPGVFNMVKHVVDLPIDPADLVVSQLAPGSDFLARLDRDGIPPGVQFVSVAGSGDVVVPSTRAHLDGATNIVVGIEGLSAHDHLPGSAPTQREIALALAGQGPTCESAVAAVAESAQGTIVQNAEDFLTAELG